MSDLRIAIENQQTELRASKDYPEALYVPQRMEIYPSLKPGEFADTLRPNETVDDAFAELKQRVVRVGPNFILVDGNFGTGKTFLLRRLALAFSEPGSPVIPLLIELRSLDKVLRAEDMLVTRLTRLGQQRIEPAQLAYMAEAGHLLILFDGYDELALRVNFDRAADHLSTITAAARGKATVVLTCRTQHFESDNQMVFSLMKQEGLIHVRLLPFSELQIQQFLEQKLGDKKLADHLLALIHDI
jgi:predicted NACHT family NTPase